MHYLMWIETENMHQKGEEVIPMIHILLRDVEELYLFSQNFTALPDSFAFIF